MSATSHSDRELELIDTIIREKEHELKFWRDMIDDPCISEAGKSIASQYIAMHAKHVTAWYRLRRWARENAKNL